MLFLILLQYRVPTGEVDRHLEEHRSYLQRHYAAGHFLLSGPQEPRTGGAILAIAGSRDEVAQWVSEDPFQRANVADYTIVAWKPTLRGPMIPAALAPDAREP